MKKRFLALFTVLLLAVLMTAAVSAAVTLDVIPQDGADLTALKSGDTIDVYIVVDPMVKIGSDATANYIYRVPEDSTNAGKAPAASATKLLSDEKFTLSWDDEALSITALTMHHDVTTDTLPQNAGNGYFYAYLAKTAGTTFSSAAETPVRDYDNTTRVATLTYDSDKTGGFFIKSQTDIPKAAVAKITFEVVKANGATVKFTLDNSYKVSGTGYQSAQATDTVTVEQGCLHVGATIITNSAELDDGEENVAATCIATGTQWYNCPTCGHYSVTVPKLAEHPYATEYGYIKEPTCSDKGSEARFCTTEGCDAYTDLRDAEALGHNYGEAGHKVENAADCENNGYTFYYCSRCNSIYNTYNANGTTTTYEPGFYYNATDGKLYSNKNLTTEVAFSTLPSAYKTDALGHNWESTATEGEYKCSRENCGETYTVTAEKITFYVANAQVGNGDGSSAENATTLADAFTRIANLPANIEAKIYLVGRVDLYHRPLSSNNTAKKNFEEGNHVNNPIIITTAPDAPTKGILFFPNATASQYFLYGPTTFDNIIIASDANPHHEDTPSTSIYARGFRIEFTENVEMQSIDLVELDTITDGRDQTVINMTKTNGNFEYATATVSYDFPSCKVYLMGGFYPGGLYEGTDGKTYTSDVNVYGGQFWLVTGGGRNNSGLPILNSTLNVHIGGKAIVGYVLPVSVHSAEFDTSGTVSNIHYHGGQSTIIQAFRSDNQKRGDNHYTVNHFFHNGCGATVIGDFMMGVEGTKLHTKNVNCYYSVTDTATPSAKEFGLGFIAKGDTYGERFSEIQENLPFPGYCVEHLGGHDYDDVTGICSFCGLTACANGEHPATEHVVALVPDCTNTGHEFDRCTTCYEHIGADTYPPVIEDGHDAVWGTNATTGDYECVCTICGDVLATGSASATKFYVSDNGYTDGGFSADRPINDLLKAYEFAAACGGDATIYILGMVTAPVIHTSGERLAFAEPSHAKHITVTGYNGIGVLKLFAEEDKRFIYALNGDTTFENIEISSWNNKALGENIDRYIYITAQHHHLTIGDNVSVDFMRASAQNKMTGTVWIIGGCYNKHFLPTSMQALNECPGGDNHVTLKSGTFYRFYGGSVGGEAKDNILACGKANVKVEIRGDVSFRNLFTLGSNTELAGNIEFILDGNLSVGDSFSLAGVNSGSQFTYADDYTGTRNEADCYNCANVDDVTLKIYSGSIFNQSFQSVPNGSATTMRPLGASHYEDGTGYDITDYIRSLTVYYDASNPSAVETANRFLENARRENATGKAITERFLDALCPKSADGAHAQGTLIGNVPATCTTYGYDKYECANGCGGHYIHQTSPALNHSLPSTYTPVSAANCTSPAIEKRVCGNGCGYVEYVTIGSVSVNAHDYNGADGIANTADDTDVCAFCLKSKQDTCAHPNATTSPYTAACGTGTKTVCPDCNKETINITSSNHNFGAYTVTVAPTATEPGVKTRTCKSCNKVETAVIYAEGGAINSSAIATDASGNLADLDVATSKLTKAEKEVLNSLLQDTSYGSEVKVSYEVEGDVVTGITYSIPLPAEYADLQNVKVVVKDDDGNIHVVDFKVEKGYIVFEF